MQKIISLFQRNYDGDHLVRDELVPDAEWVVKGEGVPTRKFDGTCCLLRKGILYKRYEVKCGKTPPHGFEPAQEPDPVTGECPGWIPVGEGKEDQWHREAWGNGVFQDGTYELCGPKVQGNPEKFASHVLIRHGSEVVADAPRTYAELKSWFGEKDIEGLVWHHPDGRMVKIKKRDFGLTR